MKTITKYFSFVYMFYTCFAVMSKPAYALYQFTDLGDLPGGFENSRATDVNNNGYVVGRSHSYNGERAFLWRNNIMLDLGDLPGGQDTSAAQGINDNNLVTGWSSSHSSGNSAFLWDGALTKIASQPGLSMDSGYDINSTGDVVGIGYVGPSGSRALLWKDGVVVDLGVLPGGFDSSWAFAINDSGQVVGLNDGIINNTFYRHAFIWQSGVMADLGLMQSGYNEVHAFDINNKGQVVGYGNTSKGHQGFIWENGVMLTLGVNTDVAYGINSLGQVVGTLDGGGAFLWDSGTLLDLNTLTSVSDNGWWIEDAVAINDKGQIVGTAYNGNYRHAYLLSPVPEADLYTMMWVGLLTVVIRINHNR